MRTPIAHLAGAALADWSYQLSLALPFELDAWPAAQAAGAGGSSSSSRGAAAGGAAGRGSAGPERASAAGSDATDPNLYLSVFDAQTVGQPVLLGKTKVRACASASMCKCQHVSRGKHVRMRLTWTCRQDASRLLCGAGALAQRWSFVYQLCRAPNGHAHDYCMRGDCMACRASVHAGGVVSPAAAGKRPSQDARPAPAESQQQQGSCAAACAVAQVHKAAGSAGCGRRTAQDAAGSACCGHTVFADAAATAATGAKSAAGTAVCVCFCGVQQGCVLAGQGARREVDTCWQGFRSAELPALIVSERTQPPAGQTRPVCW